MSADMKVEALILITLYYLPVNCELHCASSDWNDSDKKGYYQCSDNRAYIQGFEREAYTKGAKDGLDLIKSARCCLPGRPWLDSIQTDYVKWISTLDEINVWVHCPVGYFLQGIYRRGSSPGMISEIEAGRCTKPADHPHYYKHCYEESIYFCFGDKGLCWCNGDYFVVGLYKGDCDELRCIWNLKCCTMVDNPEELSDLYMVKYRVMSRTRQPVAGLAGYLGYGWCAGCMNLYCGESFVLDRDVWEADQSGYCHGYMHSHRLSIKYSDWEFSIKNIEYSNSVTEDLVPESFESGIFFNNHSTDAAKYIEKSQSITRTITHIKTSSWRESEKLGLSISFSPPGSFSGGASYTFTYETSESTTEEESIQLSDTLTTRTTKVLTPNTAAKWDLMMTKTRTTMSYIATIQIRFSLQLQGFLIWGGGSKGKNPNYHYLHRGSGRRPFFNYAFGNKTVPFYTALKRETVTNSKPWLWHEMIKKEPGVKVLIDELTNEKWYEFQLTGKFIDMVGKEIHVNWSEYPPRKNRPRKKKLLKTRRPKKSSTLTKAPKIPFNNSKV